MGDVDGPLLDKGLEAVPQVQVLAGGDWHADGVGDPLVASDVVPGHGVFHPRQAIRFQGLAQLDHLFGGQKAVAVMVDAQRHVPAHRLAHHGHDLGQLGDALVGDLGHLAGSGRA